MYALVDIKGKQYKVEKGSIIKIDRLNSESGDKLEFDSVLLVSGEDEIQVGQPFLKGIKIKATVEDHVLDKKLIVFKYKKRKGYRKKQGHRQKYTLLKVEDIAGLKSETKAAKSQSSETQTQVTETRATVTEEKAKAAETKVKTKASAAKQKPKSGVKPKAPVAKRPAPKSSAAKAKPKASVRGASKPSAAKGKTKTQKKP